jgi:hypothetical protein
MCVIRGVYVFAETYSTENAQIFDEKKKKK